MDSAPSPDPAAARRRRRLAGAAVMVAAVGLAPVFVARGGSGAAGAASVVTSSTAPPTTDVAVAPTTSADGDTTTTSVPDDATAATTTTAAAPVAPSAPATSTTTTTAVSTRSAAAAAVPPSRMTQVEAIADASGFDWRTAGVTFHVAYHPEDCCHWGIYDYRDNSLWIGPSAFASSALLRYVVLHELAHAWQWATGQRGPLAADMAAWGFSGNNALEYSADCVATVWGATTNHYWSCPAAAKALVSRRLAGDWS